MTAHFQKPSEISETFQEVRPELSLYARYGKRAFDLLFVTLIAVPVGLVVLLLAGIIALDGGKPFFFQRRVGLNGKIFWMVKLRSMVVNSEAALTAHIKSDPRARAEWDLHQKLEHDPRVTRIGRIIRKLSLDELPQFWNVFTGAMSVVGPRPMLPSQRELYPGEVYFRMRPGVTGLWQIGDRTKSTFAARASFDRKYYTEMGFFADLSVMIRTIAVVCRGTGV